MNRDKLPRVLVEWLENRDFHFYSFESGEPGYLTEDEIYSAAFELRSDMEPNDFGNSDYTPQEKATITKFINREGKTHKRISMWEWYEKGR